MSREKLLTAASQIYQEAIKALANAAVGHGKLSSPRGSAFVDNPLCGDCVEMQVDLSADRITALAHQVKGCLLCRASASLLGQRALGSTLADIERVAAHVGEILREDIEPAPEWRELGVFKPVHGHTSRYRCVELPFQALIEAMRAAH